MSGSNLSMDLAVFQHRHPENKALAEVSIRSFRILQTSSTHIERLIPNLKDLVPNLSGLVPNLVGLSPNLGGLSPNLGGLSPKLGGRFAQRHNHSAEYPDTYPANPGSSIIKIIIKLESYHD